MHVPRILSLIQVFPRDYRRALAESEALAKAEAAEAELLDSYNNNGHAAPSNGNGRPTAAKNGHKPKDAFEELKALAAAATVSKPPRAITIK
jgi:glutamate synthase (NADPH/NADH)